MARKQRIEYPGAVYHVISRGNYRKDLFTGEKTGEAFEKTIFQAAERCGWKIYAYVVMSNHYHLALETPEPNLVEGMKWLQSTFATRFNRFRGEKGHVFQGRYKSLVVGDDRPLLGLIDYIHLNPVRAGLCSVDQLRDYPRSSFSKFFKRQVSLPLDRESVLSLCGLPNSLKGTRDYHERLRYLEEGDRARGGELSKRYCRGWFLGNKESKKELAKELVKENPFAAWEGVDLKEVNEARWERIVIKELSRHNRGEGDIASDPKGASWKVEIAKLLRNETTAKNPWIADRLRMGHPNYVSNLVNR
ncbi:MAG: transposase [Verrucomicrobiota bacterium]